MPRYEPVPYVRQSRPRNLRLADLYLRSGEQEADAIRRSGEIQAQLWGNVGNAVGNTASQIIQAPQIQREQAAKAAQAAQQAELGSLQLGEARRSVNDRENFDLAMTAGGGSRQKTLEALKDRPELYEKAKGHFDRIDTSLKQLLGDAAAGIRDFGDTPEAAMAAMDDLLDQGFDERRIEPFRKAIQSDPTHVKQIVDSLLSQSPDPRHQALAKPKPLIELNKDTSLFDPNKGEVIASGPQSPAPTPPNPTEASLALAAAAGDPAAKQALALIRGQRPEPRPTKDNKFWVVRNGDTIRITEDEYQPGDTPASTREQGRPVTSGDASKVTDLNTSLDDVSVLRSAISVTGSTGTAAKIGASVPNWITEYTGWGSDAKKKQALIDRVKQVIGKALEEGVLRKEDELKYSKILPTVGDPNELVITKLDGLEDALRKKKQRHLDSLTDAGYDTTKFIARDQTPNPGGGVTTKGSVTVTTPDGQTFTFPDQGRADAFKKRAGIK